VGSSCIYPLLGTTVRPNWKFCGTELDEENYAFARRNILANDLTNRIKLVKVPGPEKILPSPNILGIPRADFTMCNPPFYASQEDMESTWSKADPPSAVCTGAGVEMITEGGDEGFVLRMVDESRSIGAQIQWYSSMLGKLSSVRAVVARLKDIKCRNWVVGTLNTGGKTRRWVVGWSWGSLRPLNVSVLKHGFWLGQSVSAPTWGRHVV
jgi:U6 snRNA m6A methyltransferase